MVSTTTVVVALGVKEGLFVGFVASIVQNLQVVLLPLAPDLALSQSRSRSLTLNGRRPRHIRAYPSWVCIPPVACETWIITPTPSGTHASEPAVDDFASAALTCSFGRRYPGILIVRVDARMFFANTSVIRQWILRRQKPLPTHEASSLSPTKMTAVVGPRPIFDRCHERAPQAASLQRRYRNRVRACGKDGVTG